MNTMTTPNTQSAGVDETRAVLADAIISTTVFANDFAVLETQLSDLYVSKDSLTSTPIQSPKSTSKCDQYAYNFQPNQSIIETTMNIGEYTQHSPKILVSNDMTNDKQHKQTTIL